MRLKAEKFLKKNKIEDVTIPTLIYEDDSLWYKLSELLAVYEFEYRDKEEKSRFTIDVRKPQFKWFCFWATMAFIGFIFVLYNVIEFTVKLFI